MSPRNVPMLHELLNPQQKVGLILLGLQMVYFAASADAQPVNDFSPGPRKIVFSGPMTEDEQLRTSRAMALAARYLPGLSSLSLDPRNQLTIAKADDITSLVTEMVETFPQTPQARDILKNRRRLSEQGIGTDSYTLSIGVPREMHFFTIIRSDVFSNDARMLTVLFHEMAHVILLRRSADQFGAGPRILSQGQAEIQADDIAIEGLHRLVNDPKIKQVGGEAYRDLTRPGGTIAQEEEARARWRWREAAWIVWTVGGLAALFLIGRWIWKRFTRPGWGNPAKATKYRSGFTILDFLAPTTPRANLAHQAA